jgi:hypothetical protein
MSVMNVLRSALQPAGSRPGKASHFHLLAQMKVTKAKGLTRFDLCICLEDRAVGHEVLGSSAEVSMQMCGPNRVEALFFGDFFLGQQKKVTRPPGGTGAVARRAQAPRQGEPPHDTTGGHP